MTRISDFLTSGAERAASRQQSKKTHTEKVGESRSPKRMTDSAKKAQKKAAKEAGKGFKDSFKDTAFSVKSAGKTLVNATGINGKQKKEQAVDKIYGITRGIGTTIAHPIRSAKEIASGIKKTANDINDITKDYSKAIRDFAKYAENLKMSRTVQNHMEDVIKRGANAGRISRPYIDSNGTTLLLKEIMESRGPISDAILKSGLRWDVKGTKEGGMFDEI